MLAIFVSASIAAVMTSIYAFRFSTSRDPTKLLPYFLLFFGVEWACEHYFLEPGTLGVEVGLVSLFIAALFGAAILLRDRYDTGDV